MYRRVSLKQNQQTAVYLTPVNSQAHTLGSEKATSFVIYPNLILGQPNIKMAPAIVVATLQSAVLTLCSLLIARFLTSLPPPDIPSLLLYTLISTPPNFLWQQYIESQFPGYTLKKLEVDDGGKGVEVEKKLNPRNTLVKIGLDQTLGAVVNVAAYIGGTRVLRGVPLGVCWDVVKEVCASRKEVCLVEGTLT